MRKRFYCFMPMINGNDFMQPLFAADAGGAGGTGSDDAGNDDGDEDADDGSGEEGKKGKDGKDTGDGKKDKTFTQSQVNRMMSTEKKQGRNAVFAELGLDPNDKKSIELVKQLLESQKSSEQKTAEEKIANEARVKEAERKAFLAEAKVEAIKLGVQAKYVDDVITLAEAKVDESTQIKDVIAEFKTKYPVWFEAEEDTKGNVGKKGTGSSVKANSGKKSGEEEKSLGARLAASRKPQSSKKSYWGNK